MCSSTLCPSHLPLLIRNVPTTFLQDVPLPMRPSRCAPPPCAPHGPRRPSSFSRMCLSPCASPHVPLGNKQMPGRPWSPRLLEPSIQTSTIAEIVIRRTDVSANAYCPLFLCRRSSVMPVNTHRCCLHPYLRWLVKHYFSLSDERSHTNIIPAQKPSRPLRSTNQLPPTPCHNPNATKTQHDQSLNSPGLWPQVCSDPYLCRSFFDSSFFIKRGHEARLAPSLTPT